MHGPVQWTGGKNCKSAQNYCITHTRVFPIKRHIIFDHTLNSIRTYIYEPDTNVQMHFLIFLCFNPSRSTEVDFMLFTVNTFFLRKKS